MINGIPANNFLTNFNDASVNYSGGITQDQQQLAALQQALAYLQDPANQATEDAENGAGWSQYMIGQLTPDIAEQQNLLNYANAQQTYNTAAAQNTSLNSVIQQLQGSNYNTYDTSTWGAIQSIAPQIVQAVQSGAFQIQPDQIAEIIQQGNGYTLPARFQGMNGNQILAGLQNGSIVLTPQENAEVIQQYLTNSNGTKNPIFNNGQVLQLAQLGQQANTTTETADQQAQNQAQAAVANGLTLGSPNYQGAQQQIQNYYGINGQGQQIAGDNGLVQQQQSLADQSIYQQAYQLKQQIAQQAAQNGASSSGEREQAVGNVSAQAANQSAKIFQQNATAAQNAIDQYNQTVQQQQTAQNAETNALQADVLSGQFNTAAQTAANAYNANQAQANTTAENQAKNTLTNEQQNSSLWNSIAGTGGSGLGSALGTAANVGAVAGTA